MDGMLYIEVVVVKASSLERPQNLFAPIQSHQRRVSSSGAVPKHSRSGESGWFLEQPLQLIHSTWALLMLRAPNFVDHWKVLGWEMSTVLNVLFLQNSP